ncbi:MAG TPA: MBOAT family protein [Burkholderiales bacterium]|nr:MBOAT family protein [Burkholderiales bacterium]
MLFDSPAYILFLLLVVIVYWRLAFRAQNFFLLGASYFFYGWWDWRFLFLMAASTLVDFIVAQRIAVEKRQGRRKALLLASLVLNLSVLGFFKYFNFFVDSFVELAPMLGLKQIPVSLWQIILPPAISFYTFQEVAYIVDVYRRKLEPSRSITDYALFVSLFPHLIAGPIQQPSHLLPQVQNPRHWDSNKSFDGLMLILEGLFRKVVIADNCALVANAAFSGNLGSPNFLVLALGTMAFALQIYGDFSGYSNIARGSAQLLGFHFMVNFRQPYLAQSLQDFWRRWHISLSSWLRDYLYIPLGGSRLGNARTYVNLMTTMLLGGLWHGANWTFVVWGGIHGAGLAIERLITGGGGISPATAVASRWFRRLCVFAIVCVAWIFFRSQTLAESMHLLSGLAEWNWEPVLRVAMAFLAPFVVVMLILDVHLEKSGGEYFLANKSLATRAATGVIFCVLTTLFGANQTSAFIYFQF